MSDPNHEAQDSVADWAQENPLTKRSFEEQDVEVEALLSSWVWLLIEVSVGLFFILGVVQFCNYILELAEAFQW